MVTFTVAVSVWPGIAGAVITDGVSEAVAAEVVWRRSVSDAGGCEGDRAVRTLRDGDDRQTGIERRCQIVGIGVVGQHVDGVVARVLINGGAVVDRVRRIVDVVDGDVHRGRVDVAGVAAAVIADGVGEAVRAEVVWRRCVTDAGGVKATVPCVPCVTAMTVRPALNGGVRLSASVSLASTLMALLLVSSSTVALSSTASGASLMLLMVTLTVAVSVCPASLVPLSLIV